MNDLMTFIDRELTPVVFKRVDRVLPEMKFSPYNGGWRSPLCLDGRTPNKSRPDKSVITPKYPYLVLEQGGETMPIISLYKEFNGCHNWTEAAKAVAQIVGVEFPELGDSEGYRRYMEKQQKLEELSACMRRDLRNHPEAAFALQYLKEKRGYDDGFIDYCEFGYCTIETAERLREALGEECTFFSNKIGRINNISIPYRNEGHIKGFVFRHMGEGDTGTPKYVDVFISKKATKSRNLFGLTSLIPIASDEWDKSIVIVEGEIDAMRASYAGITNVVAASGGSVSEEALKEAKLIGATTIKLLFDRGEQGTEKKIREAAKTIRGLGMAPYVAILPQQQGEKVDVDSYLRDHTGEELRAVIREAHPLCVWEMLQLQQEVEALTQKGDLQNNYYEESKRRTIALMTDPSTSPTDRNLIANIFSHLWGAPYQITPEAIQEEADRIKAIEDLNRQRNETLSTLSEAYRMADSGDVEGSLELLGGKVPQLNEISMEAQFSHLLKTPTPEEVRARLAEKPRGIATEYYFGQNAQQERLILPAGALTLICAPTSHGKSRMLQNLALQIVKAKGEGDVLYFTYEEDTQAVIAQVMNCYIGEDLSTNNLRTIDSYYRGDGNYIRQEKREIFHRREAEFLSLLSEGRLRFYHKDYYSSQLISAIRYVCKKVQVKAVMVDYIQLVHAKGARMQRKEELKQICKELMSLSIEIKKPVLLAAQLNREAYSPLEMSLQNITEASDIEHAANIALLMWNSNVQPLPKSSAYYRQVKGKEKQLTLDAQRLENMGFKIGEEGKIYAILAKNRGGHRNIDAVLDYNGNTGRITQPPERIASHFNNTDIPPLREDEEDYL